MFKPKECAKGAALVFALATIAFHSARAGLIFAAVPLTFMVIGWFGG